MSIETAEVGDLVQFKAPGEWVAEVEAEGIVIVVYKNGNMKVQAEGGVYKVAAGDAIVLAKEVA